MGYYSRVLCAEVVEWYRALLRAVPGEGGCALRARLYGFRAGPRCRVLSHVTIHYPEHLVLGSDVGISSYTQINAGGGVEIGDGTLIGPGCHLWSQNHLYQDPATPIRFQGYERAPVTIGAECWIGAGAIVLPGVSLGDGAVVAAGAVVSRSFPAASVVAGVPARLRQVRGEGPAGDEPGPQPTGFMEERDT